MEHARPIEEWAAAPPRRTLLRERPPASAPRERASWRDGFRSLRDGESVEYEEHSGEKGLLAKGVKRMQPAKVK